MQTNAMRDRKPPKTILKLGNFRKWKDELRIHALNFEQAGKGFRADLMPVYREPGRMDRRVLAEDVTISDSIFTQRLSILLGRAADPTDVAEATRIEEALEALHRPVYTSDVAFTSAYNQYAKNVVGLEDSTLKFMHYIISSIEDEAMDMLRASPPFMRALDADDILGVIRQAEVVLGLQGQFSLVAVETAYDKLTQDGPPALKWAAYTNLDADYRAQLAELNQPVNQSSATIRYLTRLKSFPGEWDNKVAQLLSRVPLPTVAECVVELQAQVDLTRALSAARGKATSTKTPTPVPTHSPTATVVKNETAVLAFTKKANKNGKEGEAATTANKLICWNCDKRNHGATECRGAKQTCTVCNVSGHQAKHHEAFTRVTNRNKGGMEKKSHVNVATIDDNDFLT